VDEHQLAAFFLYEPPSGTTPSVWLSPSEFLQPQRLAEPSRKQTQRMLLSVGPSSLESRLAAAPSVQRGRSIAANEAVGLDTIRVNILRPRSCGACPFLLPKIQHTPTTRLQSMNEPV
jgi:hypothetical protein